MIPGHHIRTSPIILRTADVMNAIYDATEPVWMVRELEEGLFG